MNELELSDYKIAKINFVEKILLHFVKGVHVTSVNGSEMVTNYRYKHMFGKTYILNKQISVERVKINDKK